jgi:hypothetical protein
MILVKMLVKGRKEMVECTLANWQIARAVTRRVRNAEMKDQAEMILEKIVNESKAIGTDATRRSDSIGALCVQFRQVCGRRYDAIKTRLEKEGLDTNISRAVSVHTLVELVPSAITLPIGVVTKFAPMVERHPGSQSAQFKTGKKEIVPELVRLAIHEKWTAPMAKAEAAKANPPKERKPKRNPKTLAAALRTIAKADPDTLADALEKNPELADKIAVAVGYPKAWRDTKEEKLKLIV